MAVVMFSGCLSLDFVYSLVSMATSNHSSTCIMEESKETHRCPKKVWRPFRVSNSLIGRSAPKCQTLVMSHSCWSCFCIQFSVFTFSWNAVSDYWNFVHVNSYWINLLNVNLRTISFAWIISYFIPIYY